MERDRIEELIDMAHSIFSATSIYEVMDLETRQSAEDFINTAYHYPDKEQIQKYLDIVEMVRKIHYVDAVL